VFGLITRELASKEARRGVPTIGVVIVVVPVAALPLSFPVELELFKT